MLLTDKYADKIYGTITCYDRMIIQGYIPGWSHAEGMTGYLKANSIRIFDFSNFSQPLTEQIRQNAQRIADENGIEIEFIRKLRAFRKDDRIQEIISKTGKTEGLIHIFSENTKDRQQFPQSIYSKICCTVSGGIESGTG